MVQTFGAVVRGANHNSFFEKSVTSIFFSQSMSFASMHYIELN